MALLPESWRARFAPSNREITLRTLALASRRRHPGRGDASRLGLVYAPRHGGCRRSARTARGGISLRRLAYSLVRRATALELDIRDAGPRDLGMEAPTRPQRPAIAAAGLARDAPKRRCRSHRGIARARDHELPAELRRVVRTPAVPFRDRRDDGLGDRLVRHRALDEFANACALVDYAFTVASYLTPQPPSPQ